MSAAADAIDAAGYDRTMLDRIHVGRLVRIAIPWAACLVSNAAAGAEAAAIQASSIRAHLEFLASDLMEGREAGTRGYDLAANYVASMFQQIGLQPAGTQGYFHPVPLRRSLLVPGSLELAVSGPDGARTFTDADHVATRPSPYEAEQRIAAGGVFAGYGIVSPEHALDDYAKLDVRGKFVVVLGGPPAYLPGEVAAHLGSTDEQRARAAERGAVGLLVVYTPALEARWPFTQLAPVYAQPQFEWFDPAAAGAATHRLRASALVDGTAAAALFAGAPRSFEAVMKEAGKRAPRGFDLKTRVSFARRSQHADTTSANLVGMLPGADPALAAEVVVMTSHLDHVGIGKPVAGDAIYNGALDNAAGIASMLEVARVMAAQPQRPRRSVLFVATTAEEKGLIGADYFVSKPPVARERLVGVINLDGAMPFFDLVDVIGYGADSSTLGSSLQRAAQSLGISVSPDTEPEQAYFTRSDHYPFVTRGIPGIFLIAGNAPAADGKDARAINERWAREHLHQPSDDLDQPFDYGHMVKWAELFRRWTLEAANADQRPLWYEGDYFGRRFAPAAPKASRTKSPRGD